MIENLDVNKVCVTVQSHNSWLKRNLELGKSKILEDYPAVGFSFTKANGKFAGLGINSTPLLDMKQVSSTLDHYQHMREN